MLRSLVCVLLVLLAINLSFGCQYFSKLKTEDKKATAVQADQPVADARPSGLNIAGIYQANGTNPGGTGHYSGTVTVTPDNEQYKVHWEVGSVYDGIGTLKGKVFEVKWGRGESPVGIVTYTVSDDGTLRGTWYTFNNPDVLGTETLTPQR